MIGYEKMLIMEVYMIFQQIRNATVKITFAGKVFLIDPWLEDKGEGAIIESPDPKKNDLSNPMIDLPITIGEILADVDACIITHIHLDHFAEKHLPKDMLLVLQNKTDEKKVNEMGFKNTIYFKETILKFENIILIKTEGQHGENKETSEVMGPVSGIIFKSSIEKSLYIVGDSIWYKGIEETLKKYQPDYIVVNACDARLKDLGRLIMNEEDVVSVYNCLPSSAVIVSHMDAVNHSFLT